MTASFSPGACAIWTNSAAVSGQYSSVAKAIQDGKLLPAQLDQACAQSTDLLYVLSGRQYPGVCERTVRPGARPLGWSVPEWTEYVASLGGAYASGYGWGVCIGGGHTTCRRPPEVKLGVFPIREINEVKIDGQVIPADEYRVDDDNLLVRVRPTAATVPTVRWGWPICQDLTLPDTEPGTFSVDVTYGMDPPASGVAAAQALAAQMALAHASEPNKLPSRLSTITRQGVTMTVVDPMQFLDRGLTGVYEADLFIRSSNPQRQRRRPRVYSSDVGYSRH